MTINISTINNNYWELLKQNSGAEFVKVDLHIHTPASGDAQAKNKYNFKFNIANIPESLKSAKKLAKDIVNDVINKEIKLIAITDHNSPSNTHPEDLTNTWYQLLKSEAQGKALCVLPGVEISTDDLHILVILDPKEDEPAAYTTHRINFLLQDCKFSLKEYGDYRATGMASLFDVLQSIEDLTTNCIAIPAHIDGGNKAMLEVYEKPSNVYRKLLNHPNLNAVEVVKTTTPTRKKLGKKFVKEYFESLRDKNRSPIAFIRNSDGHSISAIGKRFTYIRMGEPNFWSLKNALENPETRIRMEAEFKPDIDKTSIMGLAYSVGNKWSYIAFNANLNCIIGKRKTYKSTIMDLIPYGLDRFESKNKNIANELAKRKYNVNIFLKKGSKIFCYSRSYKDNQPKVLEYNNDSFRTIDFIPELELPRKYDHESIMERFSKSTDLMDFLDWTIFLNKDIRSFLIRRNEYLKKIVGKNFENCEDDLNILVATCQQLFRSREKQLKNVLNNYDGNLFRIKITKGTCTGKHEKNFFDKVYLKVLVGSKYKSLTRLRTGEKNAAIMVLLMNQGAFGPLIIDEPEKYLDVKSLTGILIPRIRKLKTQQQIICTTKDEHILISGDAEQVIAAQSEKKLELLTGDINNKVIQNQILEIFEGDIYTLNEKIRKLERILE